MSPNAFYMLAALLFSIGLVGLVSRRNLFVLYMSIELMLSSVSLILATLSKSARRCRRIRDGTLDHRGHCRRSSYLSCDDHQSVSCKENIGF